MRPLAVFQPVPLSPGQSALSGARLQVLGLAGVGTVADSTSLQSLHKCNPRLTVKGPLRQTVTMFPEHDTLEVRNKFCEIESPRPYIHPNYDLHASNPIRVVL